MRIWRKRYLAGLKECEWTTYQFVEQFSKKKQSAIHRNSKLRKFMLQMDGLRNGGWVISFEYINLSQNTFSSFSDKFWKVPI